MAENEATATQAEAASQPQAGAVQTQAVEQVQESISLEEAKKLRSESASLRKRLKELEDQAKKSQDASLSELERAQKSATEAIARATELESALRAERIRVAVGKAASKLGLDPELASELVREGMIDMGDDGIPKNTETVLQGLVKKWPQLKQTVTAGINAGDGRGGQPPADPKARDDELVQRFRIR